MDISGGNWSWQDLFNAFCLVLTIIGIFVGAYRYAMVHIKAPADAKTEGQVKKYGSSIMDTALFIAGMAIFWVLVQGIAKVIASFAS